jgi:hypothetical protein
MKRLGVVAVFFCLPGVALAQSSIAIRGKNVAIGESREVVLANFKDYLLSCVTGGAQKIAIDQCNSILIQTKGRPQEAHANVYFSDGRVKRVIKYWERDYYGPEGPTVELFVQTLHELMSEYQGSNPAIAVSTSNTAEPGTRIRWMVFSAGRKTVTVSYSEGFQNVDGSLIPPFVGISETLE